LVTAGSVAWKYLPSEMEFRKMRNTSFDSYDFERFVDKYPGSHRMNDVDDLLWSEIDANKDETAPWRVYQRLFPHGRHFTELEKQLATRKQTELASLRTKPDFERAARFLVWFNDAAETPEVREIMLAHWEKTGRRTASSPPVPVLRRLIQAARNGEITYSVDDDDADRVVRRLTTVFETFGMTVTKGDPALIRIHQVRTDDNEHPMVFSDGTKVPSVRIRVDLSINLPGQMKPAWTGSVETSSPERVEFRGRLDDEYGLKAAVLSGTMDELDEALESAFRYEWPEPVMNYWREFRKFLQWRREKDRPASEVLARLNTLSTDNISENTLIKLHTAFTDSYEYLKSLDDEPKDSPKGVSLEPLRKAAEFGARIDRRMADARAKFEPFE
jgi:hypothetical protein